MWYNFPKAELCTLLFLFSPLFFFFSLYTYLEKVLHVSSYNWNTDNLDINPLSVNPTKWPNTLKQIVWVWRIVWVCLATLLIWRLKG